MTSSSRDRLEGALTRAGEREHVFTRLYPEAARAAADASDARRRAGISLGPRDGAIVSIKDLFDVAGEVTLAGSRALRNAAPAAADAVVVRRLRQAGAVIMGRTNMVEFAFSGLGLNPHIGTPGNAADPSLIPGGSSSGAGVSVALGSSEIAIGSDTGGSVRIPASLNGIVGFKPTVRRVPLEGAFPLSYSLDSIGSPRCPFDCQRASEPLRARTKTEVEKGRLLELKAKVEAGRFVDADEVKVAAFNRARIVRDALLNLASRLSPLVAAESDERACFDLIDREVRQALDELAGPT